MSEFIGPILAAIPGFIAAVVAFLSKQAGKARLEKSSESHAKEQSELAALALKLDALGANLTVAQQDAAALRAENAALQKKIEKLEAKNDKLSGALGAARS